MLLCVDPRDFQDESGYCRECGELWEADLLEVFDDHTFIPQACCEAVEHALRDVVMFHPDDAAEILQPWAEAALGAPLRRVVEDDDAMAIFLDCEPVIGPIEQAEALAFVAAHHEHCGSLPGWKFGAGIWNGPTLLGVVVVGNVSGRGFNGRGWLEVRRVCLDRNIPSTLRWRACSMLYRWAAAEAEARGWERIISYTLAEEEGMTLRYARWKPVAVRKARKGWSCPSRPRSTPTPEGVAKTLWEKRLRPTAEAVQLRTATEAARAAKRAARAARSAQPLALAA